jgi:hypothetical protein
MGQFARGSKAIGICDKTGFQYLLSDLVYEYVNGTRTGLRVGKDVVDPDQPQNFVGRLRITDPMSLREPRPDNNRPASIGLFGWQPVGHPEICITGAVGAVTVVTGD